MRLCKPSFEIWNQPAGLEGVYKQIERVGRTCYKSEDKIAEGTAKLFVDRMIKSGHGAMLEHGTVYLMIHTIDPKDWDKIIARHPRSTIDDARDYMRTNPTYNNKGEENWWAKDAKHIAYKMAVKYTDNSYSKVKIVTTKHELNTGGGIIITPTDKRPVVTKALNKIISVFNTILITTNLRVLVENNWLDDLKYICEPTEYHAKRVTVKFTCDRGVSHEFVRHRVFSFAQESTRYCNYSKDKFGNELTFIIPEWCPEIREDSTKGWDPCSMYDKLYLQNLQTAEDTYFNLLKQWDEKVPDKRYKSGFRNNPWTPQQARAVLPNALKTELIMTGFVDDWNHFFSLRTSIIAETGKPHPQASELADPLYNEFIMRGYMEPLI